MTATTCAEKLRQNEIRFFLIVEQILALASSLNIISELKNLSPNFKQFTLRFTYLNIPIWIIRSILSLNSKQCHQKLHSITSI